MYYSAPAPDQLTRHLPRILCLHGGGTNARIFRAQCRGIVAQLKSEYCLVFAQAPFESQAGPDITQAYGEWGPFCRWLRWLPDQPHAHANFIIEQIDGALMDAMATDTRAGVTGEWVGILGFNQGAKVAASILYRQQLRQQCLDQDDMFNFQFGILVAGRAPLVSLDPDVWPDPTLPDASQITDWPKRDSDKRSFYGNKHILSIRTLHVHGINDKDLELHRSLFGNFCDSRSRRLVEWDGSHQVPLKHKGVKVVVEQIRNLAASSTLST
ncbi:serine hydrolase FSH [Aspergillus pseudotamarii]|uniref:Serine hydrolase FSH n=1 Tax=Aspergillus pseudotamarii TaxID=132259 RepID=A0A5N6TCJ9_ASPPS|nr:serine hydrolase FSH [Aspergillus pseudotamarii]KAE8143851.1 serine hydrolase FSH [Aspergillus pseudotamarii]